MNLNRTELQMLNLAETRDSRGHGVYTQELFLVERQAMRALCVRGLVGNNSGVWIITEEGRAMHRALTAQPACAAGP